MTRSVFPPKGNKSTPSAGQVCFGLFCFFCLLLILRNSDIAISYINRGLRLCAGSIIPSLFPFMVISELILLLGVGERLLRPLSRLLRPVLKLSDTGCCAALLGMLCGFPIGAKCAMRALEAHTVSQEEAERILMLSCNPSSAFLLNAVGISLWGNRSFGLSLYLTLLVSQLLIGILWAQISPKAIATVRQPAPNPSPIRSSPAACFTEAVRSSCFGMLVICAYVIFFSALSGCLNLLLEAFHFQQFVKAMIFCLFELSGGMSAASAITPPVSAALLSAAAVGWSGISVHCQLLSICDGKGLRMSRYFAAKLLQMLLTPLLFFLLLLQFPQLLIPAQSAVVTEPPIGIPLPWCTCLFLACCLLLFWRTKRKRDNCR